MAAVLLSSKAVGSIVTLKESGVAVNYIVVHQGKPSSIYDSSCDGTWLLRQDIAENQVWDAGRSNNFAFSDILRYLESTWIKQYESDIQNAIKTASIRYYDTSSYTIHLVNCKLFLLSGFEVGWTDANNQNFPADGARLSYFESGTGGSANNKRIAKLNGSATNWWLRSPYTNGTNIVWYVNSGGGNNTNRTDYSYGVRPALILPSTLFVSDDGSVTDNKPPTAPETINIPSIASGSPATITWGAATDSDGTIASYTLERSINESGWEQIFSGNALTYTDTIGNWATVAYRVCAVDNNGSAGDYTTSETVTVQDGLLYISGPASNMGLKTGKFSFAATANISGTSETIDGIALNATLDGYGLISDYVQTGEVAEATIDARTIGGGSHLITVTATKEDYISATTRYSFTTPEIDFPDGGKAEQLQNSSGTPIFPQTTAPLVQGLRGMSVARNLEELYENTSINYAKIELVVNAPEGSTVTVSDGITTLPNQVASDGICIFDIPNYGDWTVTAVLDSQSANTVVVIDTAKRYSTTVSFVHIYGAVWDGTSTTAWTRTDDSADFVDPVPYVSGASAYSSPFDDLMPWSGMERVTDEVAGELVKIPKFWYKWTKSGNSLKLQIADKAVDGFYVSPAHCDRGDGAGERDAVYVGRYHCAVNTLKSSTGVIPGAGSTRSNARNYIHQLGNTIWQWDWAMNWTIKMLYLVEFADWNSQTKIGYGCGNNSSKQVTGYTDSMPYHTGTTQANRTTYGLGTQYRYIEGLWDNVYDWVDGCYHNGNGLNIILNPNDFSDTTGGTLVGKPSSGYPSALTVDEALDNQWVYPTAAGGSDSTYVPDDWNFNASSPCLYVGGGYSQYLYYGLFCVYSNAISNTAPGIGSRLMKLP